VNISVVWDNEAKTILRYIYGKDWNWADFHNAAKEAYQMLDTVDHKANVIMDFQNAQLVPQGAITNVQRAFSTRRHPNINMTIIVGASANNFLQAIAGIGRTLTRSSSNDWQLSFVATLPEAYALLDKQQNQGQVKS
jgi:hypothetical protein